MADAHRRATALAARYGFRSRAAGESWATYHRQLLDHVETRDFAAAHELRLGKGQADWSADDIRAFHDHVRTLPGPRQEGGIDLRGFPILEQRLDGPVTEAVLLRLAEAGLRGLQAKREVDATSELAIFATVLLTTGALLTTVVGRGDRIAVLRELAKTHPVFGYVLVFDGFLHRLDTGETPRASKVDALMAQVGTRELRVTKIHPYTVRDGVAVFEAPMADITKDDLRQGDDPYASIFVSVPPTTGAPS